MAPVYNINKYNGLSTNHVYCSHTDGLGYLWLGTDNGVYQYNGYTLRKYDYSDGLSNTDVWHFFEDNYGKLWLLSLSRQIGYIKNNRYVKAYNLTSDDFPEIYPAQMQNYGDGVLFLNKAANYLNGVVTCMLINDTLYTKAIPTYYNNYDYSSAQYPLGNVFLEIYPDKIVMFDMDAWLKTKNGNLPIPIDSISNNKNRSVEFQVSTINDFFGRFVYYGRRSTKHLDIYDYVTNSDRKLTFFDSTTNTYEAIIHAYPKKNFLYVITSKKIYKYDTTLNIVSVYSPGKLFGRTDEQNEKNTSLHDDIFWGNILSTSNSGALINYSNNVYFDTYDTPLAGYIFAGKVNDSVGYWWNEVNKTLLKVCNHKFTKYYLPEILYLRKVVSYKNNSVLISGHSRMSLLYENGSTQDLLHEIKTVTSATSKTPLLAMTGNPIFQNVLVYTRDFVLVDTNEFYYSGGYGGVLKATMQEDHLIIDSIYFDRFQKFAYSNKYNILIAYSKDKMVVINGKDKSLLSYKGFSMEEMNLHGIERIMMDDWGNVFIKDFNKLIVYNIELQKSTPLLTNYVLQGALIDMYNSTLCIAGSFGALELKITDKLTTQLNNVYPNTKNIFYNYVLAAQFSPKDIILNTDKGTYIVDKNNHVQSNAFIDSFNVIIQHDSVLVRIENNDTLHFGQDITFADIDVIKPTGTGELKITYSINDGAPTNSGYQIILPDMEPGSYNRVSVTAYDDTWNSELINFYIYVTPYWWQTNTAKITIWVILIIIFFAVIYLVVNLTKQIVTRNNDRKNQRRELELKSIYSQINPHFIFNSLSTAQYFVKKNQNKEAFEHINQFSDLLRSYIKSSRDKYITIKEELDNLENYLQLQLTRFEDKFDYRFDIDEVINPTTIKIPSLLLQPLVENALNHGIFHSREKGMLFISFTPGKNINELVIVVEDNGVGRQKSKEMRNVIKRRADSYGNILIKELIDTFNKYEAIKIELKYIDKTLPETGTTVIIQIKNYNEVV